MTAIGESRRSARVPRIWFVEWLLYPGDLNRSMQHLHSGTGEGDVENEAATQDLLQLRTKKLDVGSLAER